MTAGAQGLAAFSVSRTAYGQPESLPAKAGSSDRHLLKPLAGAGGHICIYPAGGHCPIDKVTDPIRCDCHRIVLTCVRLQSGRCVSEREHMLVASALILPWFCNVTFPVVLRGTSQEGHVSLCLSPALGPGSLQPTPPCKWMAARQGGEALAMSVQFLFPAEDSPGGQLLCAWTLNVLVGCLRLGRLRGRSWHALTVPVQPGVKRGRRPAARTSACQDVWPVSLLSGVQYLPPSARHGQQEDLSTPEGVHL